MQIKEYVSGIVEGECTESTNIIQSVLLTPLRGDNLLSLCKFHKVKVARQSSIEVLYQCE